MLRSLPVAGLGPGHSQGQLVEAPTGNQSQAFWDIDCFVCPPVKRSVCSLTHCNAYTS